MRTYLLMATLILSLTACEYHELAEVEIQGNKYSFNEDQVLAYYQTLGSQTSSIVIVDDGTTALTFTVKSNIKGLYTCQNGAGAMAVIHIHYDGVNFSTEYTGSTGTIDLVSTGGNLIEGTFSGVIKNIDNTYTITVTNGKFSGRAS
jgi:hypothetical protein